MFINRKAVREGILARIRERRPELGITQVSGKLLDKIDRGVEAFIDSAIENAEKTELQTFTGP